jgi:hypothetical protein
VAFPIPHAVAGGGQLLILTHSIYKLHSANYLGQAVESFQAPERFDWLLPSPPGQIPAT